MYEIKKRLVVSAAHRLILDYESKCEALHGHNWVITVYLRAEKLNANGMVMDFSEIKSKIHDVFDHKVINDVMECNPTAENMAKFIHDQLAPFCYRADVEESENNLASYYRLS